MFMNLKGKRLLVLGGTNNAPDIKKFTDENDVVLVVAGLGFSQEIKAIADEMYVIDGCGGLYKAVITTTTGKRCLFRIEEESKMPKEWK